MLLNCTCDVPLLLLLLLLHLGPATPTCRFEGDGMVHATRIRDGVASYCNHWVRTHKLAEEQRAGFPIYAKV